MKIVPVPLVDIHVEKCSEPRRTPAFISLGCVGLAWLANEAALAWIHEKVPRDTAPLPDLWFAIFPEITGAIRVAEYILIIIMGSAFVVVFCHQHRWIVVRRVFLCAALCYLFRAVCITIFQLPVPSEKTYCAPKTEGGFKIVAARVLKITWSAGIEQLRPRELCGDLIISGHTISLFTAMFAFKQYSPRKLGLIAQLYYILAFIALGCILLARKHYTIDVVFGYLVASRTFWTYHSLQNSYHNNDFEKNALNQSLWAFVVPYMERDAPPPHLFLNRLQWPSSCPQRFRRTFA